MLDAYPDLDDIVTVSGVMLIEDPRGPAHIAASEKTIATNLLGTIRVVHAFIPHLMARGPGTILTVSSGIGFLPFPLMPTYGASKAGVHAYTESLRAQLAGTGVEVAELGADRPRNPRQGCPHAPLGRAGRYICRTGVPAITVAQHTAESLRTRQQAPNQRPVQQTVDEPLPLHVSAFWQAMKQDVVNREPFEFVCDRARDRVVERGQRVLDATADLTRGIGSVQAE